MTQEQFINTIEKMMASVEDALNEADKQEESTDEVNEKLSEAFEASRNAEDSIESEGEPMTIAQAYIANALEDAMANGQLLTESEAKALLLISHLDV